MSPRTFDINSILNKMEFPAYIAAVDMAMRNTCGMRYSEFVDDTLFPSMDTGHRMIKTAFSRNIPPNTFAEMFQTLHNLQEIKSIKDVNIVPSLNRYSAAIFEFASNNEDWHPGTDNAAYMKKDGRIYRMSAEMADEIYFVIHEGEDGRVPLVENLMDYLHRVSIPETPFYKELGRFIDIKEATEYVLNHALDDVEDTSSYTM